MSNVLIGIIGVILFIGLALAGALILGDDFRSSSNDTRAAAVAAQIQQVQHAVEMYRLKTGASGPVQMGRPDWLMPRFLKLVPDNPAKPTVSYWQTPVINNDVYPDQNDEGKAIAGRYVVMILGQGDRAKQVCQTIADTNDGGRVMKQSTYSPPAARMGCYMHEDGSPTYVAYGSI